MDYTAVSQEEKKNQRAGAITSFVIHVALFILAILPLLTFPDPPPGQSGVLVAFGEPNVGQGEDPGSPPPLVEEAAAEESTPEEVEVEEAEPTPDPPKPRVKETPKPTKKVNSDANSEEIALKKKKDADKKKRDADAAKKKREADAKKKAADEAERIKAAAEKAKKAAEAAEAARKAEEAAKWKKIGGGIGKTTTPGNAGQPDGDPDGKALEGVSTGSGEIGGSLGGRDLVNRPRITDNSQRTGDVVVKVCVDSNGKVISAKYTQAGSTSSDSGLIKTAINAAKQYRFNKGDIDKQCGTIKIKFRLK